MIDWRGLANIQKVDYDMIKTCRIIEGTMCIRCRKSINKGSVCLGKGGYKVCLDCADDFFSGIKAELNNYLKELIHTEDDLKKNKDKYETNNMISNI